MWMMLIGIIFLRIGMWSQSALLIVKTFNFAKHVILFRLLQEICSKVYIYLNIFYCRPKYVTHTHFLKCTFVAYLYCALQLIFQLLFLCPFWSFSTWCAYFAFLRSGELCRKRWYQMTKHIGENRNESFQDQVYLLVSRYCPNLLEWSYMRGIILKGSLRSVVMWLSKFWN